MSFIKYIRIFRKLILKYFGEDDLAVHVHVPLKAGLLALWLKQKYKMPYILTEHYGIYNNVVDEPFEKRPGTFKHFTERIIKEAAIFSPVSKNIGDAINRMVIAKRFVVVYNTVDTSMFYYKEKQQEKFRFIHVSNMAPLKNAEGIIRSFGMVWAENKKLELSIVGKINDDILKLAEETGLLNKAIFFTGEISYSAVAEQMQQSQSLILFSKTENMPCVILEALCCGLPVIATNVGGIPEVVNDSNGILIESEDEAALQHAMLTMMGTYNKYEKENISNSAKQKFSFDVIGKQMSELYRQNILRRSY